MNIMELAKRLGGTLNGRWINIKGPGHGSKDHSLGFRVDPSAPDGFVINSFAHDDPAEVRQHIKNLLNALKLNASAVTQDTQPDGGAAERKARALAIWGHASAAEGTLVERYLSYRACTLTSAVKATDALRFHPFCHFGREAVPVMVGLMRHVITDEPTGIHCTALSLGGKGKRDLPGGSKRMRGIAKHAAVKLQRHAGVLGLAEGIETALSASEKLGIPVWAMLSAGSIRDCPIIPGVGKLIIFADNDRTGLSAAAECARRYAAHGIPAQLRHPKLPNTDFNDLQQETKKWR